MQPGTMPAAQSPPVDPAPAPTSAPSATRDEGFWTAVGSEPPQSAAQPETRWDTTFHRPAAEPGQAYSPFPATPPPVEPAPPTPSLPPPTYGITPSQPAPTYGIAPSQPVYGLAPSQPAQAYGPPGQPAPVTETWAPTPPSYEAPPSGPSGPGRRRGKGAIVIAVVVAVLVAGGGAFAAVTLLTGKHHNNAGGPTSSPTPRHSSPTAPTSPAQSATATSSPTTSSSPTASPTVSPTPSGVAVGQGVAGNAAEPGVVAFLNSYFKAINAHDYAAYNALLEPQLQQNDTQSSFDNGYGTTHDSAETLTSIAGTGGGGEAATVSFTSHQSAADSATNSTCTSWIITLYLEPNGQGYLDGPAPSGYHASFQAC
jgi:hypothetical protein